MKEKEREREREREREEEREHKRERERQGEMCLKWMLLKFLKCQINTKNDQFLKPH